MMSGQVAGHVLQGSLGAEDVRALFERCASLKFTGLLELSEGARRTSVTFVGGDPLDGPDLFKLGAVWRRGTYRLVQRALDLSGSLADGVEIEGMLAEASPQDLFHHCEEYRLSADIEVVGTDGQRANVRFSKGRLESAEVNGQPNMAALSAIGGWRSGAFRLVIRPLFSDGAPPRLATSDVLDTARVPLFQGNPDEADETATPAAQMTARPSSHLPPAIPVPTHRPTLLGARLAPMSKTVPGIPKVPTAAAQTRGGINPFAASARPRVRTPMGVVASSGLQHAHEERITPQQFPSVKPAHMPSLHAEAGLLGASVPVEGDAPFRSARSTVRSTVIPPAEHPVPLDPAEPAFPALEATTRSDLPNFSSLESLNKIPDDEWAADDTVAEKARELPSKLGFDADLLWDEPEAPVLAPMPGRTLRRTHAEISDFDALPTPLPPRLDEALELPPEPVFGTPMSVVGGSHHEEALFESPESTQLRGAPLTLPIEPHLPESAESPESPESSEAAEPVFLPSDRPEARVEANESEAVPSAAGAAVEPGMITDADLFPAETPEPPPPKRGLMAAIVLVGAAAAAGLILAQAWPSVSKNAAGPLDPNAVPLRAATTVIAPPPAALPAAAPPAAAPPAAAVPTAPVAVPPAVAVAAPVVMPPVVPLAAPNDESQKLIAAARKAAIEGNKKGAMKAFGAAWRINAKDPAFAIYVPMALGKTGRGTLVLDGKGVVVVDGHPFKGPKTLNVAAGPHTVVVGARVDEIMVEKNGSAHAGAAVGAPTTPVAPVAAAAAPVGASKAGASKRGGGKVGKRRKLRRGAP